jgi:hypothetical protein
MGRNREDVRMGLFFQAAPTQDATLESEFKDAVLSDPPSDTAAATHQAKEHVKRVRSTATALKPNVRAFVAVAIVFIFLIFVAYATASAADAVSPDVASQMRDLSEKVQGLLQGWSGAVLGLVAGEAVGKKAS